MKNLDFKGMTNDELTQNYIQFKSELFGLKFQHTVGQLTDTTKIEVTKKNIARALTEMNVRGIDANKIKMPVVAKDKRTKGSKQKTKIAGKKDTKEEKKSAPKAAAKPVAKEEKKPAAKTSEKSTVKKEVKSAAKAAPAKTEKKVEKISAKKESK